MTKWNYLKNLAKDNPADLQKTWVSLGEQKYNSKTKVYNANSLFKVNTDKGDLANALIYCITTYNVSDKFPSINWDEMTVEETSQMVSTDNGVISPFFKVIALQDVLAPYLNVEVEDSFIPFKNMRVSESVVIDEDDLITLMTETGAPFVRLDEYEWDESTREVIERYILKPAFKDFYTYFPIVEEENLGNIGAGCDFDFPLPQGAHGAIPYFVLGTSGTGVAASKGAGSPFAIYSEMMQWGGGVGTGGGFGGGVSYRKPVPGFTGIASGQLDARLQGMQAAQGYTNYFRAEKVKKYRNKEDGKLHIKGFSTVGGTLCVKWLMHSYDYDDLEYELEPTFRDHAKAMILRNLGMLRNLLKSDIPGGIDFNMYITRADKLDEISIEKWKTYKTNYRFAIMRGGK